MNLRVISLYVKKVIASIHKEESVLTRSYRVKRFQY
ncbi:hypothetical protein [Salmonella phage SD-1_S14]|nr:hypothetical protein [Salmonella phage SD-1_S14]